MRINFTQGFGLNMLTLRIDIKIGNAVVESYDTQGPFEMLRMQCGEMVCQAANDERPIKITMTEMRDIELPNGDWVTKPYKLMYANNVYMNNFDIED